MQTLDSSPIISRANGREDFRLRLLGELAAGISHELAQPLLAAHNFAFVARTLSQRLQEPPARLIPAIDGVLEQIDRAMKIMRHLQDFISRGAPTRECFDLNESIESAVAQVQEEIIGRKIHIVCNLHPALPPVWADGVLVQQVVVNLLRNASEAITRSGGGSGKIEIETELEPDMARVSISDTGPGLPAATGIDELFQPFMSTKRGNLGVGLALSRAIVEQCGGMLWAENRTEGGAKFTFTLPLTRGESQ